jgi:hypothetical protein
MEYQVSDEEKNFAESISEQSAIRFMTGWQDWNEDQVLPLACDWHGYDHDFVWLASKVLFGPAVVHVATGKTV